MTILHCLIPAALAAGWAAHARRLHQRLHRLRHDPLTGLLTRDGWTRTAHRILSRHPRAVVVLSDLDGLKAVNDRYGHDAGDALIAATGERLARWCGGHGVAGRLGGDEMVAVLRDDGDLPQRLDELARLLRQPVDHLGVSLPAGASLGAARLAALPEATLSAALKTADAEMYAVKGRGRRGRRTRPALAAARRLAAPLGRFRLAA
ncbi:GGDEF domain-containing protein (plasmid) [Streptomyces uncialis]|uniref:GGDEF domain-containing protein n=1 Tax=Streptomyces uncialis TaxID=1048205 RepID=UPI002E3164FC|nr:GGDEF domain-containing protein [Streptomyces uncialis]WTE16033.1 GGDEF domain-containing protein [Streptomyces uncialis]